MGHNSQSDGLYFTLGEPATSGDSRPNPSTTLTASVETVDNDRATSSVISGVPTD